MLIQLNSNILYKNNLKENFDISGRFSINANNKNTSGHFHWIRNTDNNTRTEILDLNTPLGQNVASLDLSNNNLISLNINNKIYRANSLDELMLQNLGFTLPINFLHSWIFGAPIFNTTQTTQLLNNGFCQYDWLVLYLAWYNNNVPKIITLKHLKNTKEYLATDITQNNLCNNVDLSQINLLDVDITIKLIINP